MLGHNMCGKKKSIIQRKNGGNNRWLAKTTQQLAASANNGVLPRLTSDKQLPVDDSQWGRTVSGHVVFNKNK